MMKCDVLFEVRTELLSIIKMSVSFKGLILLIIINKVSNF